MPLNKYASWGAAPRAAPPVVGIATVVAESRVAKLGFQAIAKAIKKLDDTVQRGPGHLGETPSEAAVRIVHALGQVRDALTDSRNATLTTVNEQIAKAAKSKSIVAAQSLLADLPELAEGLADQIEPLDDHTEFEAQRRDRLAQLVAFEWKVLVEVDDPDESGSAA